MRERQLTQKQMCNMTGIDIGSMSRYLNGKKMPTLRTAKRIADLCNVPMEIFIYTEVQEEFFGKSFLKEDIDCHKRVRTKNEK